MSEKPTYEELEQRVQELDKAESERKQVIKALAQAEESLKESENKYRVIFEKAPIGITHFAMNGVITSCNEVLVEILGAQREKIIGFNMTTNVTDIQSKAAIREVFSGRTGYFEGKYTSVTGGKAIIIGNIYSPIFSEDGLQKGGICITEDITERKQAEEQVIVANERLRYLLSATSAVIYTAKASDD
ncbi:PAS domain-containing protein, partial [Thermodesulfobacteriota bacterium]